MKIRYLFLIVLLGIFGVARADGEHWTWNPYQYGDNATFVAVITIDGVEQRSDQLEVAAFCNDECRGSIICVYVPQKDRYFAYLTVNGQNNMEMNFRLWDHATNTEPDVTCDITYTFISDDHHGLPSNPFEFPFTSNFQGSVFNGAVSTLWSESGNWVGNALPGTDDDILINSDCQMDADVEVANLTVNNGTVLTLLPGKTLTVTGTLTNTVVESLVIKDGAQLVNASANVKASAEKDVVAYGADNPYGWYTFASPMDEMAIGGSNFLTPAYDLYRYNETNLTHEEWENYKMNIPDFTTFENGRGYLYANSNSFAPAFKGTLNNTDVAIGVTYTVRPDELSGFNLIGNPFPHAIYKGAGGAIDDASLASGYYTLTNEGAWHIHSFDEAIMPGQGILVKTVETGTVGIAKTTAAATSESSSKDVAGYLKLNVRGDNGEDRAFVYFSQGIGMEKISNFSIYLPSLSVLIDGEEFAIAHVAEGAKMVDVRFENVQEGSFVFDVTTEGLDLDYLHLIDFVTGAEVDLLQSPEYAFTATGEEPQDRFGLLFTDCYAVTVAASPAEGGTVVGEGVYSHGTMATLTATANEGYAFVNWTNNGDVVSTDPDFSFAVTGSGNYVANFERRSFEVSAVASVEGGGEIIGAGVYYYGETATLEVIPGGHYVFVNWTEDGEVVSEEQTYSFVVTDEHNLVANLMCYDGIEGFQDVRVSAYPNPATSMLTIAVADSDYRIEIVSLTGETVYRRENCADRSDIFVGNLAEGIYVIRLTKGNEVNHIRFVKH